MLQKCVETYRNQFLNAQTSNPTRVASLWRAACAITKIYKLTQLMYKFGGCPDNSYPEEKLLSAAGQIVLECIDSFTAPMSRKSPSE